MSTEEFKTKKDPVALNESTYNRIAHDWENDHADDTWWVEGTDGFIDRLPAGGSVLDVGCGSGKKTEYLASKGFVVAGADLSEKMVEIARGKVTGAPFYVADMHDLSVIPGEFDGVFVQAALLHIPKAKIDAVIEQLKSRIKAGGLLYIAVKGRRENEPEEAIVTENDYGYDYDRFFSYFTMQELKDIFARHKIMLVYEHVESMGKREWLQVVGRKT